jgi:hypothetical protein
VVYAIFGMQAWLCTLFNLKNPGEAMAKQEEPDLCWDARFLNSFFAAGS